MFIEYRPIYIWYCLQFMLPPNLVLSNNTILTSTYIKPGIRPNFAIIFFYGMMTFFTSGNFCHCRLWTPWLSSFSWVLIVAIELNTSLRTIGCTILIRIEIEYSKSKQAACCKRELELYIFLVNYDKSLSCETKQSMSEYLQKQTSHGLR